MSSRSSGRTLTVLLLFLVCVVAVVLLFSYFSGFLKLGSAQSGNFDLSGSFSISTTGQSGTLYITLQNTGSTSITGVGFFCPGAQFATTDCGGLAAKYRNSPVSSQNPDPPGQSAVAVAQVQSATGTSFVYAQVYVVSCTATFSDGTTLTHSLSLPAQL